MNRDTKLGHVRHNYYGNMNSADGKHKIADVGRIWRVDDKKGKIIGVTLTLDINKLMQNYIWEHSSTRPDAASLRSIEVETDNYDNFEDLDWQSTAPLVVRFRNAGKTNYNPPLTLKEAWQRDLREHYPRKMIPISEALGGAFMLPQLYSRQLSRAWQGLVLEPESPTYAAVLFFDTLENMHPDHEPVPGRGSPYPRLGIAPGLVYELWTLGYQAMQISLTVDDFEEWVNHWPAKNTRSPKQSMEISIGDIDVLAPVENTLYVGLLNYPFITINPFFDSRRWLGKK